MKRIVLIITVLFALNAKAQSPIDSTNIKDSVVIAINWQIRDVEYVAGFIYQNEFYENLVDSIRPAYRKLNNPNGTSTMAVKGYTKDFLEVLKMLRNDVCAIRNNAESRLSTMLQNLNIPYINARITQNTANDNSQFADGRAVGKFRLTRKRN